MPLSLSVNIDNSSVKNYYNNLNKNYLNCWESFAKKDIDRFEKNFIRDSLDLLAKARKNPKVLEVGFGPGRIAREILKYNIEYYGVDISEEMLKSFEQTFGKEKKIKKLKVEDISKGITFKEKDFDLIVAWRVLYYNQNWKEIFNNLSGKLGKNGILVFCMPNKYSLSIFGNLFGKVKGNYTSLKELKGVLEKNRLRPKIKGYAKVSDIVYDICVNSWLAKPLLIFEIMLRKVFGELFLSKMFYVQTRREVNINEETLNYYCHCRNRLCDL